MTTRTTKWQALTLTQPWATLAVVRAGHTGEPPKRHETRAWAIARERLPLRLAIHAGKGHAGARWAVADRVTGLLWPAYAHPLTAIGYASVDPWAKGTRVEGARRLPLGAIVGLVTVTRCVNAPAAALETTPTDRDLGNFAAGRWAWVLRDQVALPAPLCCRGAQGLWTVPDDVAAALDAFDQGMSAAEWRALYLNAFPPPAPAGR